MDKEKVKQALDRKMSKQPLFTQADRERFYDWKTGKGSKKQRFPAFPAIITTALLFITFLGGAFYFGSENMFQPQGPTADQDGTNTPEVDEEPVNTNTVDYDSKVKPRSEEIKESFNYGLTLNEAQALYGKYGEGITYEKTNPSTGETNLTSEFVYFTEKDFIHEENMTFSKVDFQQGKLGLLFEIIWDSETEVLSAMLTHLNEDGTKIVTEAFTSDGYFEINGEKQHQVKYDLDMQGLVLEAIGDSINKSSEKLTLDDLSKVERLTIDGSDTNGIYDVEGYVYYYNLMTQLKDLTINQAKIPNGILAAIPNLEKVTFIGPGILDLSSVAEGLAEIRYLNIKDSSFQGTTEDILQLENLSTVVLDKSVITDWRKLEAEGITVLENP